MGVNLKNDVKDDFVKVNSNRLEVYIFSICQSIGSLPIEARNLLALEKGLLVKNPLYAESGLGWADFII